MSHIPEGWSYTKTNPTADTFIASTWPFKNRVKWFFSWVLSIIGFFILAGTLIGDSVRGDPGLPPYMFWPGVICFCIGFVKLNGNERPPRNHR